MPTDRPSLSRAQFTEVDRLMLEVCGIARIQRMESAGPRLAECARPLFGSVVAGKRAAALYAGGGNRGRGMAGARQLGNREDKVGVAPAADPERERGAAAEQRRSLQAVGLLDVAIPESPTPDPIQDAPIGCGLAGG